MPRDFNALDCAREQLRTVLQELAGTNVPTALRIQVGLLAAQVALAGRSPLGPGDGRQRRPDRR